MAGCLAEVAHVRNPFDAGYDDSKSGRIQPIDGEALVEDLRQRE